MPRINNQRDSNGNRNDANANANANHRFYASRSKAICCGRVSTAFLIFAIGLACWIVGIWVVIAELSDGPDNNNNDNDYINDYINDNETIIEGCRLRDGNPPLPIWVLGTGFSFSIISCAYAKVTSGKGSRIDLWILAASNAFCGLWALVGIRAIVGYQHRGCREETIHTNNNSSNNHNDSNDSIDHNNNSNNHSNALWNMAWAAVLASFLVCCCCGGYAVTTLRSLEAEIVDVTENGCDEHGEDNHDGGGGGSSSKGDNDNNNNDGTISVEARDAESGPECQTVGTAVDADAEAAAVDLETTQ